MIRIGSGQSATVIAGIYGAAIGGSGLAVSINSSGQLGTTSSSRRYKEEIVDIGEESDVLMQLRPVAYFYKPEYDSSRTRQYGLIAEEVDEVAPGLVARDKDGRPETVRYPLVNAMLLNEVQKSRRMIDELRPSAPSCCAGSTRSSFQPASRRPLLRELNLGAPG